MKTFIKNPVAMLFLLAVLGVTKIVEAKTTLVTEYKTGVLKEITDTTDTYSGCNISAGWYPNQGTNASCSRKKLPSGKYCYKCSCEKSKGWTLTEIPDPKHGTYTTCNDNVTNSYHLVSCDSGYHQKNDKCYYDCEAAGYVLTKVPANATIVGTCSDDVLPYYKIECNDGYKKTNAGTINEKCEANSCSDYQYYDMNLGEPYKCEKKPAKLGSKDATCYDCSCNGYTSATNCQWGTEDINQRCMDYKHTSSNPVWLTQTICKSCAIGGSEDCDTTLPESCDPDTETQGEGCKDCYGKTHVVCSKKGCKEMGYSLAEKDGEVCTPITAPNGDECYTNCRNKECLDYSLMTKAEADEKGDGYDCSSQPRDAGDTTIDCYTCEPKTCATYGLMTKAEADKKGDGYTCPSQSKNTGDTTADCYTCEPKTCKSYNMMTEEEAKKKGDSYVCSSQSKNTGDSTTACYTCEEKTCTETCTTGSTSITCGNGYVKTEQCTDCLGKPHYTCEPKTCATYGLMTEEEAKKKGGGYTCSSQSKDTGDSTTACYTCQANTCATYGLMTEEEAKKKGGGYTCSSQSKDTGDSTTACYACQANTCKSYSMMTKDEADKKGGGYTCSSQSKDTGDTKTACYTCEAAACTGYDLTEKPDGCTVAECLSGTTTKYMVTGAADGYEQTGDRCVAVSKSNPKPRDNCIGYDLTSEPTGCTYETCISSTNGATLYKVTGAKDGYMVSGDECVMTCETWIKANKNKTQCALIISDGREIVATDGKICPTVGINFDDTYTMSAGETLEFDDPGTYYNECSGGNVSINRINAADMSSIVTAIPLYIDDVYMGTGNDWELTCDDGAECHITSLTMQGSELTLHLSAASEFVITCEKGKGTCIINVETIGDLSPSDVALTLSTSNTSTFDDGAIRLSVNGGQNWYIYKRKIVTKGSSNINVTVN